MLYSRRTTVLFMRHLWMRNSIATPHYLHLPTFPIDLLLYTEQRRATSKSRMCFHYQLTTKNRKNVMTYARMGLRGLRSGVGCAHWFGDWVWLSVCVYLSNKFCRANCAAQSLLLWYNLRSLHYNLLYINKTLMRVYYITMKNYNKKTRELLK